MKITQIVEQAYARAIIEGTFMVEHSATVRSAGTALHRSKSTVYIDVTVRLKEADFALYLKVKDLLSINKRERSKRGGTAFRLCNKKLKEARNNGTT